MGKGQANKPDFVRDINTAIMEELTAGGIKDNAAGLAGELKEIEEVTELCGLRFNGYLAKIETPRPRGTLDEVIVAFTREAAGAKGDITIEAIRENLIGSKVIAAGVVQTLKDFESGKVLVFILADFIRTAKSPMMQDDVALRGIIAHEPIYRTTPRGKRITDISVIVKNELTGNKCFIPCICWQEQADEVAGWQQGDTVELLGRYQSRQYEKVIDTDSGSRERRTAYEISVQLINRKELAANVCILR
ncbi:MAG: single-stranded DNA-binding protein [Lachnospiraceae bacterium]